MNLENTQTKFSPTGGGQVTPQTVEIASGSRCLLCTQALVMLGGKVQGRTAVEFEGTVSLVA